MKTASSLRAGRRLAGGFAFAFAVLALLSLFGLLGVTLGFELANAAQGTLFFALAAGLAGGAVVFAAAGFGLGALYAHAERAELDFRERSDSEESFFVGEGTLLNLAEGKALLYREGMRDRAIAIPYDEVRAFSVCTRRAPREKGEWSVIFELPTRYLVRNASVAKEPTSLVQTERKDRLVEALARRGVPLGGEVPAAGAKKRRFERLCAFSVPDRPKRTRSAVFAGVGAAAFAAGIVLAVLVQPPALGSVIAAVGLFVALRGASAFSRARDVLAFYREGVYRRPSARGESLFLKWEEIARIVPAERDGVPVLRAESDIGGYDFPRPAGSLEYLREHFPEKCGGEG